MEGPGRSESPLKPGVLMDPAGFEFASMVRVMNNQLPAASAFLESILENASAALFQSELRAPKKRGLFKTDRIKIV